MKKHVVSRIPSPFSKTAPVKLGDTPPKCKGGPTTSMPLSPRGSLIPQISTGTPKGFEAPYRTYMGSPSPPVEPPVSPRSKSQIPTLASSKPTPLRASHDSFFVRSGATRGKSPKRETEKQARKSQERSTPTVKKSKENGDSIKDKSAGDRKGYVAMNDDVVLHQNHQLPQSIRGTLKISSVDEEHISEDVTVDVIESTEDECIPRPPRRFRDSVTPEPSPRASPVPVLEDYIKEVKINNSEVKIPSFIVNPKPRFLLKDPPKKERSAAVGEVESDKPVQEIPIKAEVKESPNQDATRCNLETKTPSPLKKPTPVEEVAEVRRFTRSDFEKSSSRSPPGTLPKPLLPLILKARPTVQKESPSPEQEKVEFTRAEPPRPGTGEVLTPSDLLSSPTDLRRRAPGLTLGMDRKGSLDNFRERPMLGQIGVSSSFSQLSSVKDAECRSISPASSVNSSFGGLGSSGGSLKRGMSMPEAFSSPRECSPIQRDSKHPIWFVNPDLPGYVGFANLPNQVHRKSVKKGFEFTLLVVGESGLGKSTLINSLFLSDLYPDRKIPNAQDKIAKTVSIEASAVEIEERGVKLRLTVVDTPGFGDSISNTDSFKNVIKYIDDQFDKFLNDESGLNRRNIVDNRVHCCFYFINPAGHGLKPLDVAFMKAVDHKVNIVPVISKADTMTLPEIRKLKRKIMDEIDRFGIQIYTLPDCDDDEDDDFKEQCRMLKEAVPFAVVGSTQTIEVRGRKVRGRLYPWGVVEVENPDHCDFIKLRTMLITHMQDLQEVTQEVHYENFRGDRLSGSGERKKIRDRRGSSDIMEKEEKMSQKEVELAKKEAELRKMQEMLTRMQHEMQKQKPPPSAPAPSTGPAPTQLNNNSAKPVNGAALNSRMNGAPPPPPSSRPPAPQ